METFEHLKKEKGTILSWTPPTLAAPVIADPLATFFSVVLLWHGFLPHQLIDIVLVPVPKSGNKLLLAESYRLLLLLLLSARF